MSVLQILAAGAATFAAGPGGEGDVRRLRGAAVLSLAVALGVAPPSRAADTAVEFFHAGYGHYFVTASPSEAAGLDATPTAGWARTGATFAVLPVDTAVAANVCRFWSGKSFAPLSSHFYTPFAAECESLKAGDDWAFEGNAFALRLADSGGACANGDLALYRLFNNGRSGAPNHRYTTSLSTRSDMLQQGWTAEGSGIGVIGCVPVPTVTETITGHVFAPAVEGALVCLDANANGRCDAGEPQATTGEGGAYSLAIPGGAPWPLVAEVIAGRARDASGVVDASYRLASPSRGYATDITPYTTLVHASGIVDYRLGEDLVRSTLGLPPRYAIRLAANPATGSLTAAVAGWVVRALKANGLGLDLSARDALDRIAGSFSIALTELPHLRITTKGGAPITSKEVYVDATYELSNPALAAPGAEPVPTVVNGRIRGRGNSTWGQPKNPYKVQFNSDASFAAVVDVFGMPKQRNWALLADWFDRSLMRNKLALSLANSAMFTDGLKWNPSGQHVDVWLNGDYVGVYLLTEDIRLDPVRLDIRKMSTKPADGDVDGGYIVEVDELLDCYKGADVDLQLTTPDDVRFCIKTPDETAITPAQQAYVKTLLVDVEKDLDGPKLLDKLNLASFADWYLIEELFRNIDGAFYSSDYMWKDSASAADPRSRLLNMGPIWDFDRSAGNANYYDGWKVEGCWIADARWYQRLFESPRFLELTVQRWKQKRPALSTFLNASIDIFTQRLREPQFRNFERWPEFATDLVNYYTFSNWGEEVDFLRQFLNDRMAWLDHALASPESFVAMCKKPN